jgi:hypothetical protein
MNAILEPGMLVRHPDAPDWGVGQVQSNIGGRITVNFEHRGKVVIDGSRVDLVVANRRLNPSATLHSERVAGPDGCKAARQTIEAV